MSEAGYPSQEGTAPAEGKRNTSLSPQQEVLLEMLKWFHAYCEKHALRYYALGGTMLGAVRHKGFIPWDDDLDIGLPRRDYEKLCRLMNRDRERAGEAVPRYVVETIHMGRKDYLFPHAKIFDTTTTLVEHKKVPVRRGLYLDLFPLDGTGNSKEESEKYFRRLALRLNILATRVCGVREGRSFLKNAAVRAAHLIPDRLWDDNRQMQRIDRLCASRSFEKCAYVANIYGIKRMREIMPKEYFSTPTLYPFEDMQIYGPELYDPYLRALFGDWQKLPPVSEQQTHHDYDFCDLQHSYITD